MDKRKIKYLIVILVVIIIIAIFSIICFFIAQGTNEKLAEEQLTNALEEVVGLEGFKSQEPLIPVEINHRYGFINEDGVEIISCEFDKVTYFNETVIDNQTYYLALGKKDNEYYFISKNNDRIRLGNNKKLSSIEDTYWDVLIIQSEENINYRTAYLNAFEFIFQTSLEKLILRPQTIEQDSLHNIIDLRENNSDYYYQNENYTMILKPIGMNYEYYYNETYEYYNEDYYDETLFDVTIRRDDESEVTYHEEYIPSYYEGKIETFSDGSIKYESIDRVTQGWYTPEGNKISLSYNYIIEDITDDYIIISNYDEDSETTIYIMMNKQGQIVLTSKAIAIVGEMYLIKNENNKMALYDRDLNRITNDYDKIIPNEVIDVEEIFSSYY